MRVGKNYRIELEGVTPMIQHQDNISWGDHMKRWQMNPNNKKLSVPGDDRSPGFSWMGFPYFDRGALCLPSDNIMTVFREGGKKTPTGKKGASFKALTQSGIVVNETSWPLLYGPSFRGLKWDEIKHLTTEVDFEVHDKTTADLGFFLFCKRAKVGTSKHIRVRPRFDVWKASGTVLVTDSTITKSILETILEVAGRQVGCCDWRPGSPSSPGTFGQFVATVTEIA